jgi:hypothetical protein
MKSSMTERKNNHQRISRRAGTHRNGACARRSYSHDGGPAGGGAAKDQPGDREVPGYAERGQSLRGLRQLPTT